MIPRHARSQLVHREASPPVRPFPAAPCARVDCISSVGHKDHMGEFSLSNHRVKPARLPLALAEGFSYSRRCFIFFSRCKCSQWDNREMMRGKKCQDIHNKMDYCDIPRRFPNLNDVGGSRGRIVEIEILPMRNVLFAFPYGVSIILENRSSWLHPNLW